MESRLFASLAGASLALTSAPSAQEAVGPYVVTGVPTAVELVGGSVVNEDGWLNVADAPVSLAAAFTDPLVTTTGFANLYAGQTLEFRFTPGIVNEPGPDLLVLDARYDDGSISVRSSHDGFAASYVAGAIDGFTDTGITHAYHYGFNSDGPFPATVFAAPVDLSDLGVSECLLVESVRVTTENTSVDLLGVGALTSVNPSSIAVRLGTPPNPNALGADPAGGPYVGSSWSPSVDHASFYPSAILDLLVVSPTAVNVVQPGLGTILCDVAQGTQYAAPAGVPFEVRIAADCNLIGTAFCAQGASSGPAGVQLTNALDVVVGTH